jgi:Ca2+:H+ antiporter
MRALMSHWPVVAPLLAVAALVSALSLPVGVALGVVCGLLLAAAVVAAVHHAEIVAHRVGEPFGTLVLALAVTAIESSLIVSVMLAGGASKAALARDTMYATVMIIENGVIGACVLLGALRHREQAFRIEGAGPAVAALATLVTLVLVLPAFTVSAEGPHYTSAQLGFVAVSSLVMWCVFVFFQTVRHRDYFLPPQGASDESVHAAPPTVSQTWASFALLLVALVAVVGLAKVLSPAIDSVVAAVGLPPSFVGVVIALLVLAPETLAALNAARRNRTQISLNLALGSAMASIGLTIPTLAVATIWLEGPLLLGLGPTQMVLLAITVVVGMLTVVPGRATRLQGGVHMVLLAAYIFLAANP